MKKFHITILTPYYLPVKGGITSYVSNLANTLGKYGLTTTVIARYGNTGENVYITNQKIYFILKSFLVLCQKRPDVIHAHSNWYTLTPPAIYKIIHPKTRLIFTFHTEPLTAYLLFKSTTTTNFINFRYSRFRRIWLP